MARDSATSSSQTCSAHGTPEFLFERAGIVYASNRTIKPLSIVNAVGLTKERKRFAWAHYGSWGEMRQFEEEGRCSTTTTSFKSDQAYQLCDWVDTGASGSPPVPRSTIFLPPAPTRQNPNFAVVLQLHSVSASIHSDSQQYAVVVRGTQNSGDAIEDFDISTVVNLPMVSGAQIAQGAADGLSNVLALVANNQPLQKFLSSINWNQNSLFVTGHSLGGTIASLLAPWVAVNLFGQSQPIKALPTGLQAITFAPFAAGNQAFANFLNAQKNYSANFNEKDAVPHVWATSGEYSVDNMYKLFPTPGPHPIPLSMKLVIEKKLKGIPENFSYVQTSGTSFSYDSAQPPGGLSSDKEWLWELSYQHNQAYSAHFNGKK